MIARMHNLVATWAEFWDGTPAALVEALVRAALRVCKGVAGGAQGQGMAMVGDGVRTARTAYLGQYRAIANAVGGR